MKKNIATLWSLIFMFSIVILAIVLLSVFLDVNFLYFLLGFELAGIIGAFVVGFSKRRLDVKVRWILFLVLVPIVGLCSYIFFGKKYRYTVDKDYKYLNFKTIDRDTREKLAKEANKIIDKESPEFKRSFLIGSYQQGDIAFTNSDTELFSNASYAWRKILEDLNNAKEYILINYYIIEDGDLYRNFKKLLEKKIKEGVRVYLIYDFVGCFGKFTFKEQKALREIGVNVVSYMPMFLPFLTWKSNYRDHRKDISIDGKVGYIGGSNITDEYINKSVKYGLWNDEQVRITGEAVQGIEKIFASDWMFVGEEDITRSEPTVGTLHTSTIKNNDIVQIVSSGPNHPFPTHLDILMSIVGSAKKRVWLSSPYFVPPAELTNQIAAAARAGLDVRLLLPGITDKFLLLDLSKKHTDILFDAGVKIYSMNGVFNHTKQYLVDDDIVFVGSTNLDYRALFADQQTTSLVKSKKLGLEVKDSFKDSFKISKKYENKPSKEKNFFIRFIVLLINWAAPIL